MFDRLFPEERTILKRLSTPAKIQDFLDTLPMNHEEAGETHMSVRRTLRARKAHCIEGALVAAAAFAYCGQRPLLMDLRARRPDDDHVVALYRVDGHWGAISKTNHACLRFRDPIYRTLRELALSYFHEWFMNDTGKKMLESYSRPIDLSRLDTRWMDAEDELWELDRVLDSAAHYSLVSSRQRALLRPADPFERTAGRAQEWPAPRGYSAL